MVTRDRLPTPAEITAHLDRHRALRESAAEGPSDQSIRDTFAHYLSARGPSPGDAPVRTFFGGSRRWLFAMLSERLDELRAAARSER